MKEPKLSIPQLEKRIRILDRITSHLSEQGSLETPDQVAELRRRVKAGYNAGNKFDDYTAIPRRESQLLSLYLMDLGDDETRQLLPPFDEEIATSILGNWTQNLKKHLRRQATQLYFAHYGEDRIGALGFLADRLGASWRIEPEDRLFDDASRAYQRHADLLFVADAPSKIAKQRGVGESIKDLAARFGVPIESEFRERLFEEMIVARIRDTSPDEINEELDTLVLESKERRMRSGYPLGAEVIRILIDRSISEFSEKVPSGWKEKIVTYSCDPRLPDPAEQSRWWGWAGQRQKNVALRALTELTLRQFIELLRKSLGGTAAGEPFEKRAKMLLKIFDLGKVIDARLIVDVLTYDRLTPKMIETLRPLRTSGGRELTSFVCLRCTDDVYLIEGTHSFALRGFLGGESFPIPTLWSANPGRYFDDSCFRISEYKCHIFQRHHTGDWLWDFDYQLRQRHIEWHGL
ncbi:hypothetical protein HZ994_18150 [Akkermansiaceae bacterium]|nr:hypothetical protein HZ994_18150 [Akkermansiaceae bacterium]